ncbi:MAG TPA: hypothetical protein VMV10_20035 [Pirellulales bacterium]|nr:hypothetical protein [Pirellulales bacterium]
MNPSGDDPTNVDHNRARRVKHLLFAALAGGATALNWLLMKKEGYGIPSLAVLSSMIAWALFLGALLPFSYAAALEDDLNELGRRPTFVRLVCTSALVLSVVLAFVTCSLLGMPLVVSM